MPRIPPPVVRPPRASSASPDTARTSVSGQALHVGHANPTDVTTSTSGIAPATSTRVDPESIYAAIDPKYTKPSAGMGTSFNGYKWDAKDLDAVMLKFCVGDAMSLVKTAIALDRGDKVLSVAELTTAARKLTSYVTKGQRWSQSTLADVMTKKGIAEETALLRAAKRHDNGDKFLSRPELEQAADVLNGVLKANDVAEIQRRIDDVKTIPGVTVETLGVVEGHDVRAVHFPHTGTSDKPKLKVIVTGGVHGNEPCGAAAAMLLLAQLQNDPRIREEVSFTIVPLVNPRGLGAGTRRTPEDLDLNRHFHDDDDVPEEVGNMKNLFEKNKYDLALDLHSGYSARDGFWLYHRNGADLAKPAMSRFQQEFPALSGASSGKPMEAPGIVASEPLDPNAPSPGTLKDYAITNGGAKWSFTVEAPGSVSYLDQVLGENDIVHQLVLEARLSMHRADDAVA